MAVNSVGLDRVNRRLKSVLQDVDDALAPRATELTAFKAVRSARMELARAQQDLMDVEDGLASQATKEWARLVEERQKG